MIIAYARVWHHLWYLVEIPIAYKPRKPKECFGDGLEDMGMKSLLGIFLIFISALPVSIVLVYWKLSKRGS